jgi:hypothetical protein
MFMAEWARRIAAQDRAFATQTGGDVHEYLVQKLFYTLTTIRGPRQWGWKFLNAGASQCVCCFVYADGSPTQLLPLGESRSAQECWWPCLVLWEEKQAVLPFYCPALARANARPLPLMQRARLREREELRRRAVRINKAADAL